MSRLTHHCLAVLCVIAAGALAWVAPWPFAAHSTPASASPPAPTFAPGHTVSGRERALTETAVRASAERIAAAELSANGDAYCRQLSDGVRDAVASLTSAKEPPGAWGCAIVATHLLSVAPRTVVIQGIDLGRFVGAQHDSLAAYVNLFKHSVVSDEGAGQAYITIHGHPVSFIGSSAGRWAITTGL